GQQLNEVTSGGFDGAISIDEDTDTDGGGGLLTEGEIVGEVFADLTRHDLDGTGVGLAHAEVLGDGEPAGRTDRAAHVELAVADLIDVRLRIADETADAAAAVRGCEQGSGRPVALDAERDEVIG